MIVTTEKCYICGAISDFCIMDDATLLRDATCCKCGAGMRTSDIARIIVNTILHVNSSLQECTNRFDNFRILEAASCGHIHDILINSSSYTGFEFIDNTPPGEFRDGVLCNDLQNLSFPDNDFDLIITQDVMEHVEIPQKAFSEINRVLKKGGYHIFTVPLHEGRKSLSRKGLYGVYHSDYLRNSGAFVYTDWGDDIIDIVAKSGMNAQVIKVHNFYKSKEITNVDESYDQYKRTEPLKYYKYNSVVIVAKKDDIREEKNMSTSNLISWTGERYVPWANLSSPDIDYEHLNRYYFAANFVKGKKALDLASGEGYGAYILASCAEEVIGIDVDEQAIKHATNKYFCNNLRFDSGSISEIPIVGEKVFDVITCFEALEHIEEQDKLFKEVARLLKDDGLLIISSPNKKLYTDELKNENQYHLKELYYDEFAKLVTTNFKNVKYLGQKVISGSQIWPLGERKGHVENNYIQKVEDHFNLADINNLDPMYFIAIASNSMLPDEAYFSNIIDISDELKNSLFRIIFSLEQQKKEIEQLNNEQRCELNRLIFELANREKEKIEKTSEIERLTAEIVSKEKTLNNLCNIEAQLRKENVEFISEIGAWEKQNADIKNSHSWKYTAIFRKIGSMIKNILRS